jgi:hypothetical protein
MTTVGAVFFDGQLQYWLAVSGLNDFDLNQ